MACLFEWREIIMKYLILAEKPSQASSYAKALGDFKKQKGYFKGQSNILKGEIVITWCIGHLVQLAEMAEYDDKYKNWQKEDLPFIPEEIKYKISKIDSIRSQFNNIKNLCDQLNDESVFVIATDPDREGEAIARYVINQIPQVQKSHAELKRLWANTLEAEGLRDAFQKLRPATETYPYYLEAQARGIADWIVGINLTRLTTLTMQSKIRNIGLMSVGRVQTPTLFMVYNRNKDIENFKPQVFYTLSYKDKSKTPECIFKNKNKYLSKEEYEAFLSEHNLKPEMKGTVKSVEENEKKTKAPKLFKLGGIQKVANKKWNYSLSETLDIVQALYDKGFLSYPRTDSTYITQSEFDYLKDHIETYSDLLDLNFETKHLEPRKEYVNGDKVLEHYAIVPTKSVPAKEDYQKLSEKEKNIYKEVVTRTLCMFAEDYTYNQTVVNVEVSDVLFTVKGKETVDLGWKKYIIDQDEKSNEKDKEIELPKYTVNEVIDLTLKIDEGKTKPPAFLTEGTLGGDGGLMETCAKELSDETYKDDLKEASGIGTPATRASIVKGLIDKEYLTFKKKNLVVTEKGKILCEALSDTKLSSPLLTAEWEHELKTISEKGTIEAQQHFIENIKGYVIEQFQEIEASINSKVKQADFSASEIVGECPVCKSNVVKKMSKKKQPFYVCEKEDCEFILFGVVADKTISASDIKALLTKGKTKLIKGFKSKKGTKFDAYLKLEDNKVGFEFAKKK